MKDAEKTYLLKLARETIDAKLNGRIADGGQFESEELEKPCGAFVTLKIGERLRGCIGNIRASRPLVETIREMAVAASTKDPRFPPMRPDELERAHLEISVLSPLEKVENPEEIQVGRDGLYIIHGYNSGLLLPQVATELNWDRDTFLSQTCLKAGLHSDAWKHPDTEIFSFSAEVFSENED